MNDFFSSCYQDARAKVLEAAVQVGARRWDLIEPGIGVQGEVLAVDVIEVGPQTATQSLLVTSGCHGVEGYAGSALQLSLLCDPTVLRSLYDDELCLVLVHALNPYGFSYSRRVTAEGVDLNRNVVDFNAELPKNDNYRLLHPLLIPSSWPPEDSYQVELTRVIERMGMRRFQDAVTRGQYEFEDGIFFGGKAPTCALKNFESVIASLAQRNRSVIWIDLHTGLGSPGISECIFTGGAEGALKRAKAIWGEVTQSEKGTSVSSILTGALPQMVCAKLGPLLQTSITWEMGTVTPMQVLQAMSADAFVYKAGLSSSAIGLEAATQMRQAFCPDNANWKDTVLNQGMQAIVSALVRYDLPADC